MDSSRGRDEMEGENSFATNFLNNLPSPSTRRTYSTSGSSIVLQHNKGGDGCCPVCGYVHPPGQGGGASGSGGCGSGGSGGSGNGGGCGGGSSGGGGGDGDSGKGGCPPGGDKPPDKPPCGGGKDKSPGGGRDKSPGKGCGKPPPPAPKYPPPNNADKWSDACTNYSAMGVCAFILLSIFLVWACRCHDSLYDCVTSPFDGGCGLNKNLDGFFDKTVPKCKPNSGDNSIIPYHLQEQYDEFKKAAANPQCRNKYKEKCPGLLNYAATMAGGSVVSIRDTELFPNLMLCRCQDNDRYGQICDPNDRNSQCSKCVCDKMETDIVLKDEGKLIAGRCWAFSGCGKLLVSLFYPILVTGVSIHHPPQSQLLPGFFSSAPKDFEVLGYNGTDDPSPHLFGTFRYTGKDSPTQIFVFTELTDVLYSLVQFNFLSNHGNKNYTAVYKVEVHGLMDRSFGPL